MTRQQRSSAPAPSGSPAGFRQHRFSRSGFTPPFLILGVVIIGLTVLGLVMTFSASIVESVRTSGNAFSVFGRQFMWACIGVVPMLVLAFTDYRWLRTVAWPIVAAPMVLAALVLAPGIGMESGGAQRWLSIGNITVQPSEMLKLAVPVFIAAMMAKHWKRIRDRKSTRLNSSHVAISYAVFCLKKKKTRHTNS